MRRIRIPWFKSSTQSPLGRPMGQTGAAWLLSGILALGLAMVGPSPLQARSVSRVGATEAVSAELTPVSQVRAGERALASVDARMSPAEIDQALSPEHRRLEALETLKHVTLARIEVEQKLRQEEARLVSLTRGTSMERALCAHDWMNQAQLWMAFVDTSDKLAWEALASDSLEQFQGEVRRSRFGLERSIQALEKFAGCEQTWVTNDGVRVTIDSPRLNDGNDAASNLLPSLGQLPTVYPVKPL